MRILIAYTKNKKAKVKTCGGTLSLLTLLVAVSKCLAKRISNEKEIGFKEAENIVVDCIKDGIKTIEE